MPCEDWNFDDSTVQGWTVNSGPGSGLAASTLQTHDGAYSLKADLALTSSSNSVILSNYTGFPRSYVGKILHAWVWVPAGMSDPSNPSAAMLVLSTAAAYHWNSSAWVNLSNAGGWSELTLDTSTMAFSAEANDVRGISVQFGLGGTSPDWAGTVYVDSVGRTTGVCSPPTATPTLAAGTATSTRTRTSTATPSASPSASSTASPVSTATPTPSVTATFTDVPAGSTLTNTPMPSATRTPTATDTASITPSPTATQTQVGVPVATATFSSTPTTASLATLTPAMTPDGSLQVLAVQAVPNPNPVALAVLMNGPADKVELRIYSVAGTCVITSISGAVAGGWSQLPMPILPGHGLYFAKVVALRGTKRSLPVTPARLLIL